MSMKLTCGEFVGLAYASEDELREFTEEILDENAKLRELVRDALMPRLLYGIYRCPDEDMPIGDAIEWADSELRSRAEELGVELEMEV